MNVLPRFLRYVRIDTQSDPHSPNQPSTEKQKNLGRLLAEELTELGAREVELDEHGYVYATVPATPRCEEYPVICFCSHVDTSPDASGKGVKPVVHENYRGQDLVLPDDPDVVLRARDFPALQACIGTTIVTASGTTLLGADNKSGVAAIMAAVEYLLSDPGVEHGKLRILFTPDEEIGRGVDAVDMEKLGADFGYTVDGEERGSLSTATFSADGARIDIEGVSAHPGLAKGAMESAIKIAADIVAGLPRTELSPETTEGRQGFIHPVEISGTVERAEIHLILRDFETAALENHRSRVRARIESVKKDYPNSKIELTVAEQYRNMEEVLNDHPRVIELARRAIKDVGLEPKIDAIRGGTDGSRLSFMGLPCPNIFAGEHAFHGKYEWASAFEMQKAAEAIVRIAHLNTILPQ